MDNQDFSMEDLQALIASTYAGGNSWAARSARARAQRRNDDGTFAFMFGNMRLVMLLNGIPVAAFSNYVGASDSGDNMGWFYVKPGDPSVPAGFYDYPVDRASDMGDKSERAQAILTDDYLASKGIDRNNPNTFGDYPSLDSLGYQTTPPGFIEHPDIDGAYISEDGDITIEPNEFEGFDVVDNIDPANTVQSVDDLLEALRAVEAIDKTRKNYEPAEGEEVSAEATPTRAPVADIDEAVKAPESMSNQQIEDELDSIERMADRRRAGLDAETLARREDLYAEMDIRAEDEESSADPSFVRVPSNEAPVAELPVTSDVESVEQAEADVQNSEQVAEETADPATVDAAEEVVAEEAPVVEQAPIKPPRAPREPSIGAFTGRMATMLDGVTDPKQVQDIINGEEITYIDFETSGFSAVPGDGALNRPLQMGIVKVKNGEVVDRKNIWMNPEMELSEWSRNNLVDGDGNPLTDEWLAGQQSMKDALTEAVAFIGPNAILGGQNVQFDLEVLNRSLREQGIDFSFDGTIDSRDLGKKTLPTWSPESPVGPTKTDADGNKSASNSLGDLIAFLQDDGYDVTLDNWHSADADAQATHELVQALLQRAVDNNVDMGVLTDKAQRDAESASEWATYADEYDTYVADLGNYFDQTNDPNKDERLALAQPLTPESFGVSTEPLQLTEADLDRIVQALEGNMTPEQRAGYDAMRRALNPPTLYRDGGNGGQPPVTPEATPAEEPEDFDALRTELAEKYPVNATSGIRMAQRALSDTRDPQEIADEIDAFIARLRRSNGPRGTVNEFIKQLRNYKETSSPAQREERATRAERGAQDAAERAVQAERLRAEAEARLQAWIDNGGPAKVEELSARVREDVRRAFATGELPENLEEYEAEIQNKANEIATVDGVVLPSALRYFVLEGRYGNEFGFNAVRKLQSARQSYLAQQARDAAIPEKLDNLFSQYDVDGSARALFDSGASYEEVYANLLEQNSGWSIGYDPAWRMQEFIRGLSEPAHASEMRVLNRAVELRDSAQPAIDDAPSLDADVRSAMDSGVVSDVVRLEERSNAVNDVVDSVNSDVPVVDTTPAVTEAPSEPVTEIPTIGQYEFDYANPTADDLRMATPLGEFSGAELREGLREAVVNGKQEVTLGDQTFPISAVALELYNSYGIDSEEYIAGVLDNTFGGSENLDALVARRVGTSDVTREEEGTTGQPSVQEVFDTWFAVSSLSDTLQAYTEARERGSDTIAITMQNFGMPDNQGTQSVEISVDELRQRLVTNGIDMDTFDGDISRNQQTQQRVAEASGLTVEQALTSAEPRTDWRDVLNRGSEDFRDIYFIDKNGNAQRYERREDGKWYDLNNPSAKGKTTAALIRKINRDADPGSTMEIDDGNPHDDDLSHDYNAHTFRVGSDQDEEVAIDETIANDAWMHVSGGDLDAMRALERAGVTFNILDKMAELFPNSERRGDDEVVTETHEYTDSATGTVYRFEVVVTRTPDEYFYTYVRRTNLTTNESWSARVGHMSQSPYATFNNYRREIAKFHASFFNGKGPVNWFDADATRRRKKRDVMDPDTNQWVHAKDIQHNRQTMANIRALLGESPASTAMARQAEDAIMTSILNAISKYRFNERWMGIMAGRISEKYGRNISPEYMYQVADAYEAHMMNQNNLDRYGTWVSFDQRTPLDAGDTVEHVSGRRGVVRKRLGWVDSLGRYRYSDYVEVRWENGDTSWTTSRMNRLIQTSGGTDGSERIGYRDGFEDPRADYGTTVANPENVQVPDSNPIPAEPVRPDTQQATRNENSELVLEDGTVVPEHLVGARPAALIRTPDELVRGDFIGMLGDNLNMVQSPVLANAVPNSDGTGYTVPVAVRQSDGTYKVQNVTFTAGPNEYVQVSKYYDEGAVDRATPAQVNELLELLGSKLLDENGELPAGLRRDAIYTNVLNGFGAEMATAISREEFAEIIQELRALPDRQPNRAEDAAMLADVASVEAERDNNPDASQEFEALADGANIVASQSPSEEADATEEPSAPETPVEEAPVAAEEPEAPANEAEDSSPSAVPESMNGTQILDANWLDEAPAGTFIYSSSSSWVYKKDSDGVWKRFEGGRMTNNAEMNLLRQRINSGQLFIGNRAPSVIPPGGQESAAAVSRPALPTPLSEITPDVSGGWSDVPAGTQINNPDWFSGAPVGTQVTLGGISYEKKEDGKWYPTSGQFTETGYSSEDLATVGLLSRAQQADVEAPSSPWELLPDGAEISDSSYINDAPMATRISLQFADGSAPRTFVKLGNGQWELEGTTRKFTNEQITHRLGNSEANTFTSLTPADTSEVSTVVSSLSELRAFPEGTVLETFTANAGQRKKIKRVDGKWQVLNGWGGVTREWTDARVMQFIRDGGVVNNGRQPNRFAPSQQVVRNRNADIVNSTRTSGSPTAPSRGGRVVPVTYTPGSFETDVTPQQFHEIIRNGDSRALKRLLEQQFSGRMLGKHQLTNIRVSGSGFEADIADANGNKIGTTRRSFTANPDGTVSVYNALMSITSKSNRGGGFSSNYTEALYDMYRKLGVTKVNVSANIDDGGYAWGAAGFDFSYGGVPDSIMGRMQDALSRAISEGRMQDVMRLNALIQRALRGGSDRPTANEIATVQGQLPSYPMYGGTLGREIMSNTSWGGTRSVNTLEESIAFFARIERENEEIRRRNEQNGWNR